MKKTVCESLPKPAGEIADRNIELLLPGGRDSRIPQANST